MKITPLRKVAIGNLIDRLGGDVEAEVFKARRLMHKWEASHGVEVTVSRFTDKHRRVLAWLGVAARYP